MRILYPILFVITTAMILGSIAKACDQVLYDKLYIEIYRQYIKYDFTDWESEKRAMDQKHYDIDFLRKLCNNQLSSYEKGKP